MGGITWVEQDAAIRLPVEVVDEHLLQIGIAWFAVSDELPFRVDHYLVPCRSGQNNVRLNPSMIPKYPEVLIGNLVAFTLQSSLQRAEDETFPEHVHIE